MIGCLDVPSPIQGFSTASEGFAGQGQQPAEAPRADHARARHRQAHASEIGIADLRGFAAVERGGMARSAAVASASGAALDPLMFQWFNRDSILCMDELATYNWFGGKMERHHKVTHSAGEYARTEGAVRVHTNTAEGFFGLFKMALVGIPAKSYGFARHAVSPKHLSGKRSAFPRHRYATEHAFRYNRRGHDAGESRKSRCDFAGIARCLIGRHGRLRLRELFA